MNIEQAKNNTRKVFEKAPNLPICWVGGSGIGKTTMAKTLHKELGLKFIYLPLRTEDAMGLNIPSTEFESVSFVPHQRLKAAIDEPCLIYIDEFNRMERYTRAAVMELLGERTVGGVPIHPKTVILLTMNDEGDNYDTIEGDQAFKTRVIPFPVQVDHTQLEGYAKARGYGKMQEFIRKYPEALNEEMTWHLKKPDPRFLEYLEMLGFCGMEEPVYKQVVQFVLGDRAKPYLSAESVQQKVFDSLTVKLEDVETVLERL